jgi:hypothetical protein
LFTEIVNGFADAPGVANVIVKSWKFVPPAVTFTAAGSVVDATPV